ncbi:hydantoinase B/oxoprolinase family protein [Acidimangrovimonas sediminis]|uniref:hydantoinase B/oxoprolinase family protein n=1 Tax=Acidimangrovimonas sediminis TaxID=2056283 RepID=UPI0013049135|nr:hydantoinase B/oxoprolinase family protein [Acidimangrovimonas sediminis]
MSDPVLAEVARHGLQAVAEEMGAALINTAHSINIRDRRDFSCGVFTTRGQLAAQAEHIPVHLGLLAGVIERVEARLGHPVPAGQMLVTNDPWLTGSHLPDVVVLAPVDHGGTRLGYVANMAHQLDVGGSAPGSLSLNVAEVYTEGLRIPPLVILTNGEIDPSVVELFRINSRTPEMVVGDLLAQVAANTTGAARLIELSDRLGREKLGGAAAFLADATRRRLERRLSTLEGRAATFIDTLEWNAPDGTPQDLEIRVALSVTGGRLIADFTGTSAQVRGPINAVRPLTMSCLLYTVKAMLDPGLASNAGLFGAVDLITEPGSLVDAAVPAAVALCTSITSMRITDALMGAFNQLVPEAAMAASTGSMNALIIGGRDDGHGQAFSYVETYAGGQGGLSGADGADGVHCHMTNTANSPVEAMERNYPMTVLRYGLLPGTGGAGQYRGGHGITRVVRLDQPATVTVHLDRTRHRPWGSGAGAPGSMASIRLRHGDTDEAIGGKSTVDVPAGTIVELCTAGGGGWGPVAERTEAAASRDARLGLTPGKTA